MTVPPCKLVAGMGERLIKKLCNSVRHIWKAVDFRDGGSINYRTKVPSKLADYPGLSDHRLRLYLHTLYILALLILVW